MKIKKMKKLLYLSILLPFIGFGQDSDKNYVKVVNYKRPFTTSPNSQGNIPPVSDAQTTVSYLNGFGKTKQEVYHQESNTNKDIVIPFEYDEIGRQPKAYLPYVSSGQDGKIKPDPLNDILGFYDVGDPTITGNPNFETTANYYSESIFDNLNPYRVAKQGSPGDDWQINGGHEMRYEYYTNETREVKKFRAITANYNSTCKYYPPTLQDDGYYDPGELFKTTTRTENYEEGGGNHFVVEYKDKQGRIVLKQQFLNADPINTYYVYDIYGNLTYVLPPTVDVNGNINLDGLCYQYNYDFRNRLFRKKLPGKRWEYIIYDKADRPIISGPVYSPFGTNDMGFIFTRYDIYNRICYTGWFGADVTDDGIYCYLNGLYSNTLNNSTKVSPPEFINGIRLNYSIDNIPTNLILLSVNYYDDYNFYSAESQPTNIMGQSIYQNATGLLTGTWVRALTDANSLQGESTTIFYDKKTNPIYVGSTNYLGGFTKATTKYNFIGQSLETQTSHKRTQTSPDLNIIEKWSYDDHGKLVTTSHVVNQMPEELISHNTYDELGNLITKNVGGNDLATFSGLQKIDYQYNVRGWLTKINDVTNLTQNSDPTDLFAFKISYNTVNNDLNGDIKPLYNGNISETYWRTANDNILRKYSYKYDGLNRLNKGIYQKPNNENPVRNSYNEIINYDVNGNILGLSRTGESDDVYQTLDIDNLVYSYDTANNPNRLMRVYDSTDNPNGFKDDANNGLPDLTDDYSYDDNGNLRSDTNKSIANIFYNHLNLPTKIEFTTGDYIDYVYDASGKKLSKVVKKGTEITKTDYLDGFQYKTNKLQFFPTSEGYVSCYEDQTTNGRIFSYVYSYKDHLGNIRVTYSKDPSSGDLKILEENHYYPFGLKHNNYNSDKKEYGKQNSVYLLKEIPISQQSVYNYKYSSKEWQDELGLNMYSYGARNYDPAIGRFANIDPLSDEYSNYSPYSYAVNNPVFFIDKDGFEPTPYEAALMAADVYGDKKITLAGGWRRTSSLSSSNGFKAATYSRVMKNGKTEYAMAFAGTETNDYRDIVADLYQVAGASSQYAESVRRAITFSKSHQNSTVTFLGHSLGGGLSNLASYVTGRSAMTFNPAWLSAKTLMRYIFDKKELKHGNYRAEFFTEYDPLTMGQKSLGWLFELVDISTLYYEIETDKPRNLDELMQCHGIDTVKDNIPEDLSSYSGAQTQTGTPAQTINISKGKGSEFYPGYQSAFKYQKFYNSNSPNKPTVIDTGGSNETDSDDD